MKNSFLVTFVLLLWGCQPADQETLVSASPEPEGSAKPASNTNQPATVAPATEPATISADLEREKRMAVEIEDALLDGEPVYLNDASHEFLTIDTEPDASPKGAVILLHGRGFHPDWQDTIYPLRIGLATAGWRTLSVQMPVLKKNAKYNDYVPLFPQSFPRIEASIEYLKKQGIDKIVLLAHSCGAHMAMSWIRERGDSSIQAYIGVGMGATDYQQAMKAPFPLDQLKVPVLDVYGADDYPAVIRLAPSRIHMMKKAGNPLSAQKVVPGANHYFIDKEGNLVEVVAEWLRAL